MKTLTLKIIRFYQETISPDHGFLSVGGRCRFWPTCSEYTRQAIGKYGLKVGLRKGVIRILKCNPLHPGGFDPA